MVTDTKRMTDNKRQVEKGIKNKRETREKKRSQQENDRDNHGQSK